MPQNEQQKFLEAVDESAEPKVDQMEAPLTETPAPLETDPEEVEEGVKNRRHKRLEAKLQQEREANIALNERLKVIAESRVSEDDPDYVKSLERLYGTNTPESIEATNLLKSAFEGAETRSYERALSKFREEQAEEGRAVRIEESNLDQMIETIEDEYGVSLSDEQQAGYFRLLERMSPKDSDGNVIEYADPDAVWENYQERLYARTSNNRAKSLASSSMTQSGASGESNLTDNATERFLRENGII